MGRFPAEVCDSVIDYSSWDPTSDKPDYGALRSCALTCKGWLPRSRAHIFHTVELNTQEKLGCFTRSIETSPALGDLVLKLTITHPDDDQPFHLMVAFPTKLAARLPKVKSLAIESPHAEPSVIRLSPEFFQSMSKFSTLTLLRLFHVEFHSFDDFGSLVCSLPNVIAIECWNVAWSECDANPFSETACPKITSLKVDDIEPTGLTQLLRAVGSSIRHLTFAADNEWLESFISDEGMSMAYLTRLKSLEIPIRLDRADFRMMKALLTQFTCDQLLGKLTFSFHYGCTDTPLESAKCALSGLQRTGIEDILTWPQFSELEEVVFRFSSVRDTDCLDRSWKMELISMLPRLQQRGIAQVELYA
ncbi:hypothetical protein SCP_1203630 [Sparassis crispa]|uniref:F-box domain-containing protein n=1 Tax=Sparassis crispa TaxID=139825 RepID=A0A401H159_9APHY|nr:hypothetical protein SCP_1203630 [Sparassis crispa]GBE88133.1 hypothetical protein SCP_1203630 [Sparassis crispa]